MSAWESHRLPFSLSSFCAKQPLELIYCDLWGPSPIASTLGYRYYISFVDNFSRLTHIFPLKHKNEALSAFHQYKTLVENRFETSIKILQNDWGGEFHSFTSSLKAFGIEFHHSCPHTSQQNGVVERKHRHIVEMGLSMLAQSSMALRFWWEDFSSAVFIINRLPSPVLGIISPWEKAFHQAPGFSFLRTFGCACFPCLRPYQSHKFQFHSSKCVFLGSSFSHKGYKCLSSSGKTYISCHVVFNENEFPFKDGFLQSSHSSTFSTETIVHWLPFPHFSNSCSPMPSASVPVVTSHADNGHPSVFHKVSPDLDPLPDQSNDLDSRSLVLASPSVPASFYS